MAIELWDFVREAAALDDGAGRVAVIDAAAAKIGADRATVYAWLDKGAVPKSAQLIALAGAVNDARATRGARPVTFSELAKIAGVVS